MKNEHLSIEQITGQQWGEPQFGSHLVKECHRLVRIPLKDIDAEGLRMLVGQKIELEYTIPFALKILEVDPLIEANHYAGDLLYSVCKVWNEDSVKPYEKSIFKVFHAAVSLEDSVVGASDIIRKCAILAPLYKKQC